METFGQRSTNKCGIETMSVACRVDSACWAPGCLSTTLTEQERDSSQSTGAASRGFSSSSSSQTWWQFLFQTSGWEIPIIQDVVSKELWLESEFKFRLVQAAPQQTPAHCFCKCNCTSCSEPAWHYGDDSGTDDWHVATCDPGQAHLLPTMFSWVLETREKTGKGRSLQSF